MQETQHQKSCRGVKIGLMAGGAVAAAGLAVNRRSRNAIVNGTKRTASAINEASSFLTENREEIITKVKSASTEFSHLLQSASSDIQDISERASHLKQTTLSAKSTAERTARDIKRLQQEQTEKKQLEQADNVEKLPNRDHSL
ncbi:hypothetical protein [Salibacterium aidingense]|uniref:hypothetical protein n=1 Tax=Salibacterium aidingense TaxID=384933 RepID=UPI00047B07EC|nr:hypothetical protein [Salibacterium aidingense]